MKSRTALKLFMASLATLPAMHAVAADKPLLEKSKKHLWRAGINYRLGFNIKTSFRNEGVTPYINNPSVSQAHPTTYDGHSYYNGFIGIDDANNSPAPNSNNAITSNFGFESGSQLIGNPNSGYLVEMDYSQAGALGAGSENIDTLAHGLEITLGRQLHEGKRTRWGVEGGLGFARTCASWAGPSNGSFGADLFPIRSGVQVFDQFPYPGYPEAGFGNPLLDITAGTPLASSAAAKLTADLYCLRFGPYLEVPLNRRVALVFGGGLSAVLVDGKTEIQQTINGVTTHYNGARTSMVFGGYLSGNVAVRLSEHWDLTAGIQYHILDSWDIHAGNKTARLEMGESLFATVGVGYWF